MKMTQERLSYSAEELAALAGLGKSKVYTAISEGRIPARRFDKRIVILADDAREWLRSLPTAALANN